MLTNKEAIKFLDDNLCTVRHCDGHWECEILADQHEVHTAEGLSVGEEDAFIRVQGCTFRDVVTRAQKLLDRWRDLDMRRG